MSDLAAALCKRIARDLELSDWRVAQDALARRTPRVVRMDVHPGELTQDEYESLCDAVDAEIDRRRGPRRT